MSLLSVVITGANRGIGLEYVKQLLSLSPPPKHLIGICRNIEKADQLKAMAANANGQLNVLELDATDYSKYDKVVSQIGQIVGDDGIDLLINNAGVLIRSDIESVTVQNMMDNFEVNCVTPLMMTKALLPLLKVSASKRKTLVVNVTSKMGSMDDNTSGSHYPYRASKAALNMVTKSLSVDLKPFNISAIALHPGWVKTEMGGPNGLLEIHESVTHMINTIKNVNPSVNGKMLNYDGNVIPW